jgi:hypothetical protein
MTEPFFGVAMRQMVSYGVTQAQYYKCELYFANHTHTASVIARFLVSRS